MSKASTDELGLLHAAVAKILRDRIDKDEASAADISAAIKFLKDNSITAVIEDNSALASLQEKLKKRRERNTTATPASAPVTSDEVADALKDFHVH